MIFQRVYKKDILREVIENVIKAEKEILATMLLKEELINPLPLSYFNLLKSKVNEGVVLKRLGFGTREDYNRISNIISIDKKNYIFRFVARELDYQRLIIIDREKIFFGVSNLFFQSQDSLLIRAFLNYFYKNFRQAKI